MQELMATLPYLGRQVLAFCFLILIVVYIIGLLTKSAQLEKEEKEKNRLRLEELSLGAESLFFHVPLTEKENNAQ